jgi:hypothetical protein
MNGKHEMETGGMAPGGITEMIIGYGRVPTRVVSHISLYNAKK